MCHIYIVHSETHYKIRTNCSWECKYESWLKEPLIGQIVRVHFSWEPEDYDQRRNTNNNSNDISLH